MSRKRVAWHGTSPEPRCPRTTYSEAWTTALQRRLSAHRVAGISGARTPDGESVAEPGHRAPSPADPGSAHPRWR